MISSLFSSAENYHLQAALRLQDSQDIAQKKKGEKLASPLENANESPQFGPAYELQIQGLQAQNNQGINSNYQRTQKVESSQKAAETTENNSGYTYDSTSKKSSQKEYPEPNELSQDEKEQVERLKERDREVRQHEQAHIASAGGHAKGSPTYTYQTGPDQKQYAIGGEVSIDTSPVQGDPAATLQKARQIQQSATAPAEPSGQDQSVAAEAQKMATQAQTELQKKQTEELNKNNSTSSAKSQNIEDSSSINLLANPDFSSNAPQKRAIQSYSQYSQNTNSNRSQYQTWG